MDLPFNLHEVKVRSDTKTNDFLTHDQTHSLIQSMVATIPILSPLQTTVVPHQGSKTGLIPTTSSRGVNDSAALSKMYGDLPADAFEPVPIDGTKSRTHITFLNSTFLLEDALDQALDVVTEIRPCTNHRETLDPSKLFDRLPADAFEPVPIQADATTSTSTLDDDSFIINGQQLVNDEPTSSLSNPRKRSSPSLHTTTPTPIPKRKRASTDGEPNFRGYQETQWIEQFNELLKFKEEQGHSCVPHTYQKNPQVLSRWVKRQRYQYKLKMAGKISTMTDTRIKKLEDIGFVWDSHAAAWDKRFKELKQYHSEHGDCNVPSNYPENQELATWIKCQRRQYKLLWSRNKSSSMTLDRMRALNELGFIWKVREDLPLPAFLYKK